MKTGFTFLLWHNLPDISRATDEARPIKINSREAFWAEIPRSSENLTYNKDSQGVKGGSTGSITVHCRIRACFTTRKSTLKINHPKKRFPLACQQNRLLRTALQLWYKTGRLWGEGKGYGSFLGILMRLDRLPMACFTRWLNYYGLRHW